MALAMNQSFSFLASILGFYLYPSVYLWSGSIVYPLMLGTIAPILSFCSIIIYVILETCLLKNVQNAGYESQKVITDLTWRDVKKFSSLYWTIASFMVTISATYFLFLNNLDSYLEDELKLTYDETIKISVILPFTLMICVPSISLLVDRMGNKAIYFLMASVLGIGTLISTKFDIEGK